MSTKNDLKNKFQKGKRVTSSALSEVIDKTLNNPGEVINGIYSMEENTISFKRANGITKTIHLKEIEGDDIDSSQVLGIPVINKDNTNFDIVYWYKYNGDLILSSKILKSNLSNKIDESKILGDIQNDSGTDGITNYDILGYDDKTKFTLPVPKADDTEEDIFDKDKILSYITKDVRDEGTINKFFNLNDKETLEIVAKNAFKTGSYGTLYNVLGYYPNITGLKIGLSYNLQNMFISSTFIPGTTDKPNKTLGYYDNDDITFIAAVSIGGNNLNIDGILSMSGQSFYDLKNLSRLTVKGNFDNIVDQKINTTISLSTEGINESLYNGINSINLNFGNHTSYDPDKQPSMNVIPNGETDCTILSNNKDLFLSKIFEINNKNINDKCFISDHFYGCEYVTDTSQLNDDGTGEFSTFLIQVWLTKNSDNKKLSLKIQCSSFNKNDDKSLSYYITDDSLNIKLNRVIGLKGDK